MSIDWGTLSLTSAINIALGAIIVGFWKPWAKSYSNEKAKNFARKEDLDAIVGEVRAVTRAQKEIENTIWSQQTRWNHHKDVYATLLTARVASDCETTIEINNNTPTLASNKTIIEQELHTKMMEYRQLLDAFLEALSLVQLLGTKQCNNALEQALTPNTFEVGHVNWAKEETRIYLSARNVLIRQARSDLGTEC